MRLRDQIILYDGMILDGRNRYRACLAAGWEETTILSRFHARDLCPEVDGDPAAYVISANIHRRHLTAEQKRDLIAKLIKAKPEASDRQIAKQVKADHKTVGAVRKAKESTGEISPVAKRIGADGKARKQPAHKAGKAKPANAPDLEIRADTAERVQRHRASASRDAQKTSGALVKTEQVDDAADENIESEVEPAHYKQAFLLRADQAERFAVYSGSVDSEVCEAANRAAHAWQQLAQQLKRKGQRPPALQPSIRKFIEQLATKLDESPTDSMKAKLDDVIQFAPKAEDLKSSHLKPLANALRKLAERITRYAEKVESIECLNSERPPALPTRVFVDDGSGHMRPATSQEAETVFAVANAIANPIINAWEKADEEQRSSFVRLYKAGVLDYEQDVAPVAPRRPWNKAG